MIETGIFLNFLQALRVISRSLPFNLHFAPEKLNSRIYASFCQQ